MTTQKYQKIKSIFLFGMMVLLLGMTSCNENADIKDDISKIFQITVSLVYPDDFPTRAGITVLMENKRTEEIFESQTDGNGNAVFHLPVGEYTVSASENRKEGFTTFVFNGSKSKQKVFFGDFGISLLLALDDTIIDHFQITVSLVYPDGFTAREGVAVSMENLQTQEIFEKQTDENGNAVFDLPAGEYSVSASERRSIGLDAFIFSGSKSEQKVFSNFGINLPLSVVKAGRLVIKELYAGGIASPPTYANDKYVVLYNNSDQPITHRRLCVGTITAPSNSNLVNNDRIGGELKFENEGWIPAGGGMFYFPAPVTVNPGKQIVVALYQAIDHTVAQPLSINFNKPDYYCYYDPTSAFNNATIYVQPGPLIPASHYLKGSRWNTNGTNMLIISATSPAFFIFDMPDNISVETFADADSPNISWYGGATGANNTQRKIPVEWIIDGIEVFTGTPGATPNGKRLSAAVDAGYVEHNNNLGFTVYRNVDKAATEAIPENAGKIVYGYDSGTVGGSITYGSTDPSGIDAETSLKNGARIVYKDTDNSRDDFHLRAKASLRD